MRNNRTNLLSLLTILALVLTMTASAVTARSGGRVEGLVVGIDGRAAGGYQVHLIDDHGQPAARATTDQDGLYSFRNLEAGNYGLGIENPNGQVAPVAAPPVKLASGELARRDIKLMQSNAQNVNESANANYGVGLWWSSLSTAAKVWTIIGIVVVTGITYEALDDDDDTETPASGT